MTLGTRDATKGNDHTLYDGQAHEALWLSIVKEHFDLARNERLSAVESPEPAPSTISARHVLEHKLWQLGLES